MTHVASSQLAADRFTDASTHTIYSVPDGIRTIVKGIIVQQTGGAAANVAFAVLDVGLSAIGHWAYYLEAYGSDGDSVLDEVWLVMEAGQHLQVKFSDGAGGYVLVSGAELTLGS